MSTTDDQVNIKIATTGDTKAVNEAETSFGKLTAAVAAGQAIYNLASNAFNKIASEAKSVVSETEDFAKGTLTLQRQMGITAEASSGLLAVFNRFGIDTAGASKDLGLFAKQIMKVADPANYAGSVFDDLGVKVLTTNGTLRTADQVMLDVADRFKEMPNGVQKTTEAMQLFGKSGKDLLPILNLGADGIKELEAKAASMGLVLTQNNIDSVRKLIIAQKDWHESTEGIKIQLGLALMPELTKVSDFMVAKGIPAIKEYGGAGIKLGQKILTDIQPALHILWDSLNDLWDIGVKFGKAVAEYLTPKLADLFKAVQDLFPPLEKFYKEYLQPLIETLGPLVGVGLVWAVGLVIDTLKDLIKIATPVFKFLDDHKVVVDVLAGAFGSLGASMALGAIMDASVVAINTFMLVTVPSLMATLSALGTAFMAAFPWAAVIAAAALAVEAVMHYINQINDAIATTKQNIAKDDEANRKFLANSRALALLSNDPEQRKRAAAQVKALEAQGYAGGTDFAPGGMAIVGEQGPELVNLPRGSQVIPTNDTKKMLANHGQTTINQTNYIYNQFDINAANRELAWRLSNA